MAVRRCVICGRQVGNWVVNPGHSDKPVCLPCVNSMIFNLHTLDQEFKPLTKALEKGVEAFKVEFEKEERGRS